MSTPRASERICRSIGSPPNVPHTATSLPERQLLELANDLLGQLAGWRQDDGLRPAPPGFEHFDQGNSESRRLAGARLGLPDDIESVECTGYKGRLNGAGCKVADLLQGLEHGRAQAHGWEPVRGFLLNSSNQSILQKRSSVYSCDRGLGLRSRLRASRLAALLPGIFGGIFVCEPEWLIGQLSAETTSEYPIAKTHPSLCTIILTCA